MLLCDECSLSSIPLLGSCCWLQPVVPLRFVVACWSRCRDMDEAPGPSSSVLAGSGRGISHTFSLSSTICSALKAGEECEVVGDIIATRSAADRIRLPRGRLTRLPASSLAVPPYAMSYSTASPTAQPSFGKMSEPPTTLKLLVIGQSTRLAPASLALRPLSPGHGRSDGLCWGWRATGRAYTRRRGEGKGEGGLCRSAWRPSVGAISSGTGRRSRFTQRVAVCGPPETPSCSPRDLRSLCGLRAPVFAQRGRIT